MASKGNVQTGDKSRFRVLLIEGDVLPGELQVFAQTLAAAIRPSGPTPLAPRAASPAIAAPKPPAEEPSLFTGVVPEDTLDAEEGAGPEAPAPKPQTRTRMDRVVKPCRAGYHSFRRR